MSLLYREEDEPFISVSDDTYKDLALHELCNAISTDSSNQELTHMYNYQRSRFQFDNYF